MRQLITPNPNIACTPGWCLMYVRQTFGLAGVYPSATAGWAASRTKHRDQNFPAGVWLPLWFFMEDEPLGHVVLRAPDGSIYSTTDLSNTPRHHPSLGDLMRVYAGAGLPLTYLGWTEDIENVAVVDGSSLAYSGTTTPTQSEEDDMPITNEDAVKIADVLLDRIRGGATLGQMVSEFRGQHLDTIRVIEGVDEAVLDTVVDGVAGDKITLRQLLAEYRAHIIQVVSGIAAEAAQGGASLEDIQKAIADGLSAGIDINLSINGKEAA